MPATTAAAYSAGHFPLHYQTGTAQPHHQLQMVKLYISWPMVYHASIHNSKG
jgi:hypothetical protein